MQKNFYSLITAVAALCAVSCDAITGCPADEANSYAKAIELTRKSVDSERFKIYSISFMEMSELSNDLGLVTVKMVNKDDQAFSQSYYLSGLEPTDLREVQSVFESPGYETTVGIDLGKLSPETIAAQIAQAKTMLPEGHTFKSVGCYEIEEEVPAGMEHYNRNKVMGPADRVVHDPLHRGRQGDRKQRRQDIDHLLRGKGDRQPRRKPLHQGQLNTDP